MPGLGVSVLKVFRATGDEREEPRNQPVPRGRFTGRQELPAELLQRPIGFGAVHHHRGRHPVVGSVGSTAGDRNEVVDRREQLPEGDVALRHLPVWVRGKLFGQQTGEKTQGAGEHQRGAGVPVDESVTEEHGGGHGRRDGGPAGGLRCERVLAPGDLGGLTPVTLGESFANPLEGSGSVVERSHWSWASGVDCILPADRPLSKAKQTPRVIDRAFSGVELGPRSLADRAGSIGDPFDDSVPTFLFLWEQGRFDGNRAEDPGLGTGPELGLISASLCTLLCLSACSNFCSYPVFLNVFAVLRGWSG